MSSLVELTLSSGRNVYRRSRPATPLTLTGEPGLLSASHENSYPSWPSTSLEDRSSDDRIWSAILHLLELVSSSDQQPYVETSRFQSAATSCTNLDRSRSLVANRKFYISLIERAGDNHLLVSWHNSTFGHYTEQRWVKSKARVAGQCALSGSSISFGDSIYYPLAKAGWEPCNAGTMILGTQIERQTVRFRDVVNIDKA